MKTEEKKQSRFTFFKKSKKVAKKKVVVKDKKVAFKNKKRIRKKTF